VKSLMISLVYAAAFGVPAILVHMRAGDEGRWSSGGGGGGER